MENLGDLQFELNKLVLHPEFEETISEISALGMSIPEMSGDAQHAFSEMTFASGELVTPLGEIRAIRLDAQSGQELCSNTQIAAYDESIDKFNSLEGAAYFTSHSLVYLQKEAYLPANYLTFYFYTRSGDIIGKSKHIRHSLEPEMDSKRDYIRDRIHFLGHTVPHGSVLLVDGPLIGGDVYTILMRSIGDLHAVNTFPIFFVKNSASNLVTDNIQELRARYNSDLHWAFHFLKPGERTSFFLYRDRVNPTNAKIFCYLKGFDLSPQRVELHVDTYERCEHLIDRLMDMVFYMILVQGDRANPQVRPIAVAEMYARHTLKLVNISKLMYDVGIIPTMNQVRFGR